MKNSEYWKKRMEILEAAQLQKGQAYYANLEKQFREASANIEKEISKWYQRFAINNNISMAEAKKLLNTRELAEFKWDVHEYIKFGEKNAINQLWMKQLENASARVHVSRLEALKVQMQQQIEVLYGNHTDGLDKLLRDIYSDGYYHTAFEIQKGFNIGWDLHNLNSNQLDKVLSKPWTTDGKTFSGRIWTNKQQLIGSLQTHLTQSVITGQAPDRVIKSIAEDFRVSRNKAGRLIMTESAAFASASQKDAFNALDVERFEIVATLDNHTSEICQELDGHIFDMNSFEAGVTAPPFHPWCRTTTVPYFEDNFGERAARGADGKTYYVPSNMKYADWKKTFVDGGAKVGLSQVDRTSIIDTIMNSETISKFDDVHKAIIKADLEKASDTNVQIVQQSIDKLHLNPNGTGTCFYRPGSGYMEMNMGKEPLDNIRTFWHEYGHYIDDVQYDRNGLILKTLETVEGRASSHTFEWFGASSRANRLHKYNTEAAIPDLQKFLDQIAPGKYEVSGESNAAIYLKGTQIQVGEQWGANRSDFSTLMDEINDGLKKQLGADDSNNYLLSLGKPQNPEWSDYYTQYRTPKRQTLKTKPAYKGAEEAWYDAVRKHSEALEVWEKVHPNAYKEADALYQAYRDRTNRFAAITDLLDGEARGEMGMRILWGGHDPTYFKTNNLNINEGWANWFQMNFQNDVEMLNYLEQYAPEAKRIFEECYQELLKQTFGG
jgi:phage putative head morphogenesis protein, SPP1 gp7 family